MTQAQAVMAGFLAVGVLFTWRSTRWADATEPRAFRWLEALAALVLGAMAFVWLRSANPEVHTSNEIFLLVVDCLLFGQCFTAGTGSSVVLDNGAVWTDLLLTVRHFHGLSAGMHLTVLALTAAGIAVTFWVTSRVLQPALAAPAALLTLALMGVPEIGSPTLDCSTTFLFATLAAAFLLVFSLSGNLLAITAAAVFVSHAVNGHPSAVSLVPALLVVAGMAGRLPLASIPLAVAAYVAASYVTSSQALIGNWQALQWHHLVPWVALGSVLLSAAGVALRRPFQRLSPQAKAAAVAVLLVSPHLVGILLLVKIGHPVLLRYLPPVVAPASVAAVFLLSWLPARMRQPWVAFALPMAVSVYLLPPVIPGMAEPPMPPMESQPMTPMESAQFTPEGVEDLQRLTEQIRQGALGGEIIGSSFRPSYQGPNHEGAVRIDIVRHNGHWSGFTLLRPPIPQAATSLRYFVLYPDESLTPHEVQRVTALVNDVFTVTPWSGDPSTYMPHLHIPGPDGAAVSQGRMVLSVLSLFASTLAGLALLVALRPRSVLGSQGGFVLSSTP